MTVVNDINLLITITLVNVPTYIEYLHGCLQKDLKCEQALLPFESIMKYFPSGVFSCTIPTDTQNIHLAFSHDV